MRYLAICLGLFFFSCGDSPSKKSSPNTETQVESKPKYDLQRKQMIANESTRWGGMATPKNFDFNVVNDSTFTISSEFEHPFLEKEVRFTYTYEYTSSLDSIKNKGNDLTKKEILVEGEYIESKLF